MFTKILFKVLGRVYIKFFKVCFIYFLMKKEFVILVFVMVISILGLQIVLASTTFFEGDYDYYKFQKKKASQKL